MFDIQSATRGNAYDFIPDKLIFGKFKEEIENPIDSQDSYETYLAIPSCRYKNSNWTQVSRFSSLTGFKPNVQRDAEKELNKAVLNTCEEIENVPTSGFKIVSFHDNPYNYCGIPYKYKGDAVIYDPRGFTIQINLEHLARMIEENDGDMTNFELTKVKYVYIAAKDGITLIPYDSKRCQDILKAQAEASANGKPIYVKPSQFEVGHAYLTSDCFTTKYFKNPAGIYIYAGRHDTYSPQVIHHALANCKYPEYLADFKKNHNSWSAEGEACYEKGYVFFLAQSNGKKISELSLDEMILIVDSPSKLFCKEVEIDSKWKFPIDKTSPMNIKTINDFMSSCPYFTKIDLNRLFTQYALKPMSFRNFARAVIATNSSNFYRDKGLDKDTTIKPYPFTYGNYNNICLLSLKYSILGKLSSDAYYSSSTFPTQVEMKDLDALSKRKIHTLVKLIRSSEDNNSSRYYWRESGHALCTFNDSTIGAMYDAIKPIMPTIFLENGKQLDDMYFSYIADAWKSGLEDIMPFDPSQESTLTDMWNEGSKNVN